VFLVPLEAALGAPPLDVPGPATNSRRGVVETATRRTRLGGRGRSIPRGVPATCREEVAGATGGGSQPLRLRRRGRQPRPPGCPLAGPVALPVHDASTARSSGEPCRRSRRPRSIRPSGRTAAGTRPTGRPRVPRPREPSALRATAGRAPVRDRHEAWNDRDATGDGAGPRTTLRRSLASNPRSPAEQWGDARERVDGRCHCADGCVLEFGSLDRAGRSNWRRNGVQVRFRRAENRHPN
jgi:hypothetical protein